MYRIYSAFTAPKRWMDGGKTTPGLKWGDKTFPRIEIRPMSLVKESGNTIVIKRSTNKILPVTEKKKIESFI
jgi:hypothetical protein